MTPLKHSKGLAARMGRWSANHWKTAVFGWIALVVVSVFVSMQVATKQIKQTEATVGESHTADKIISDAGFAVDKNGESIEELGEMVIIQSKTLTRERARPSSAAVVDAVQALRSVPAGHEAPHAAGSRPRRPDLEGRPLGADPRSTPDGQLRGSRPLHRQDHRRRGQGAGPPPGLLHRVSRRLDRQGARQGDPGRPRQGRADLDPAHDHHPDDRARLARRRADPAARRRSRPSLAATGLLALSSQGVAAARTSWRSILLSASPSASTTRSSTCGVSARSGGPAAARAPRSRPPPRPRAAPCSSRASPS